MPLNMSEQVQIVVVPEHMHTIITVVVIVIVAIITGCSIVIIGGQCRRILAARAMCGS